MGIKRDGDHGTMHRILKILAWRYSTPSKLTQMLGMTRQAVHYHLSRLKEWGFVIEHTRECILAVCIDYTFENCDVVERDKIIGPINCKEAGKGGYYIYMLQIII